MKWENKQRCILALGWGGVVLALGACLCADAQTPAPVPASHVSVTGQLSRVPVENGDSVRFWITIENNSTTPLAHIRLDRIDPAQFEPVPGSMSVPSAQACRAPAIERPKGFAVAAPAAQNEICAYLGPREIFTFWGDLRARDSVDKQNAFAVLEWESPDGPSIVAAPLGEIESLSSPRWIWHSLLHNWELGVPTFTAFFAGLFALWKWRRDVKEARIHEQRQNESRKQREIEDNRSKTWNLMLRDSHRVALKYYMPIGNGLSAATQEILRYRSTLPVDASIALSAFHYLLKFHWDVRRTARELGAYYFKNRTAEVLVDDLFQEHRALLQVKNAPTKQLLDRCLDLMSANVTSDNVAQMIAASQPDILAFWNHVLPWFSSSGCQQDLEILSGYLNVLIYEANRPYLHWYGTSEPLALSPSVRATVEWVGWKYRIGKETDSYLEEASSQNQSVV